MAYSATNPYNSFYCHKTLEENFVGQTTKVCAGFLTLQHNENGSTAYDEDGFEPSPDVYEDAYEMEQAYAEENDC